MDELTKEFLAESTEGLDRMERCLTELETRPNDRDLLDEIFRAVHTIKGATGFLGLPRLERLTHAGESLLGSLREGHLTANEAVVSGLLQLSDRLRTIVSLIENTGKEGTRAGDEDSALLTLLLQLNGQEPRFGTSPLEPNLLGTAEQPEISFGPSSNLSDKTLRVDVEVLNRMVNLVGELVLIRNQLLQSHLGAANLTDLTRRLDGLTADLRGTVMQARMQPVGQLFGKFPRLVRDLAHSCGKQVRIEFSGQETGLDKSLLEAIRDPLTHAVRNAIDHGIEEPQVRRLAGKPAEGVVRMRAFSQNGCVTIEIADDGRGIYAAQVLKKAVENGLLTPERAESMTMREVLKLLFLPGFSTTQTVTHLSGRGVGMDVVLSNVEKVGGTVEIDSKEGHGTILRLRVPLTLAIVPALVVRSGCQIFCIPQGALVELVYVQAIEEPSVIVRMGEAELYRLRETLLPMMRLDLLLCLAEPPRINPPSGSYLAVLETEGCRFGLMVDELMNPEEIVAKPLSPVLQEIGLFSGVTVLGNGGLALILDVAAIASRSGVSLSVEAIKPVRRVELPHAAESGSFLVFEDQVAGKEAEQKALPLAMVERIEIVAMQDVHYAKGRPLLRHQGQMLLLLDAGGVLPELDATASVTVLICDREEGGPGRNRRVGIVVRRVIDIALGELMERDLQVGDEYLAQVNGHITTVQDTFGARQSTREVA